MAADYGSDFSGVGDVTRTLREVSGPRCVVENIANRLISPRGCLWYDPAYGFDLRQFFSGAVQDTGRIVAGIVEQAEQDERVDSASAVVRFFGETLTIALTVVLSEGTFEYTLTADKVTGRLLLKDVIE